MKNLLAITMLAVSMLIFAPNCEATDVWVEHWNNENVDIVVMNDTIVSDSNAQGRGFTVSTKMVKKTESCKVL